VQLARFFWLLVTPLGPVGDWRPPALLATPPTTARLGDFDPFFRLAGAGGPVAVTGLNLRLFGTREDHATGRGSAIIALPDGVQSSYAVGEEIMPGVILAAVAADNVTISRNGVMEQLFLDQSTPAPGAAPAPPQAGTPPQPATPVVVAPAPAPAAPPVQLQPRVNNNQISGLSVSPGGDGGQAFRAAGFQPGDVIMAVNGQRVNSAEQALALVRQSGGQAAVTVERGGRPIQLTVRF
jgi:general secretion pathway protein C